MHHALLKDMSLLPPHTCCQVGSVTISLILQVRKPRCNEVEELAQGHTQRKEKPKDDRKEGDQVVCTHTHDLDHGLHCLQTTLAAAATFPGPSLPFCPQASYPLAIEH